MRLLRPAENDAPPPLHVSSRAARYCDGVWKWPALNVGDGSRAPRAAADDQSSVLYALLAMLLVASLAQVRPRPLV